MRTTHLRLWRTGHCHRRPWLVLLVGFGRVTRHDVLNDLIYRALNEAGLPAVKKSQDQLRSDGKSRDQMASPSFHWRAGTDLVWDATVVDTFAPSYLFASTTRAGAAVG